MNFCYDVQVLEDSRAVLIAADVSPDGPFSHDEKIKDGTNFLLSNHSFFVRYLLSIKCVALSC